MKRKVKKTGLAVRLVGGPYGGRASIVEGGLANRFIVSGHLGDWMYVTVFTEEEGLHARFEEEDPTQRR